MPTELIQTKDYLLFIDEKAEIKEGKIFITKENIVHSNYGWNYGDRVVVAYYPRTEDAQELDLPWLPNPFEEDEFTKYYQIVFDYVNSGLRNFGAMMGLLKLKEIAQSKQFSLEDMKNILEEGLNWFGGGRDKEIRDSETWFNHYIQSLSTTQQLPKEFIIKDMEYLSANGSWKNVRLPLLEDFAKTAKLRYKTITNPKGKEELVGKYVY